MQPNELSSLAIFAAGGFAGVGIFFWVIGALASRYEDKAGGWLGRAMGLAHGIIALVLIFFALTGL